MIIGLVGKMKSGKSEAAKALVSKGFVCLKMADPLKDMLRGMGLTDAELEGHLKEYPCPLLMGHTPRYAMQTLGTEWGRDILHQNIWTHNWTHRAQHCVDAGKSVVCDDVRFPNEADAVISAGGVLVRVVGQNSLESEHSSESYYDDIPVSYYINNIDGVEELQGKMYDVLSKIEAKIWEDNDESRLPRIESKVKSIRH